MSDAKVACGSDGIGKVRRQSRSVDNLPLSERILHGNLATARHTQKRHPWAETSD
ncbi:hypothetical protein NXW19_14060 [Bacteroides ovatus]|nr:hypothetical protein [Phocaeicola vulgatus]MCE8726735.1 hypothetical protein [Phocaeicola vulgatus]UVP11882.1 hypothetical protein NXW52_03380 [Bacteroides ovatus]UVP75225.1 hypothetical protein NXW19_14060 [Bacteroides ovatus]